MGELRVISGDVEVGSGVTLTTCYNFGASIDIAASVTTLHVKSGTTNLIESAAATTVDCLRGEFILDSSGTVASFIYRYTGYILCYSGRR